MKYQHPLKQKQNNDKVINKLNMQKKKKLL